MDPLIAVLDCRTVSGATSLHDTLAMIEQGVPIASLGQGVRLSEALEREWSTDAHFVCYSAVDAEGDRAFFRINKRGSTFASELREAGGRIEVPILAFDHDRCDENGKKTSWSSEPFEQFLEVVAEGNLPFKPSYWYSTKHGSRFVYVLERPVSPDEAEKLASGIIRDFRAAGIDLDAACSDWTRLFRLPRTRRDDAGDWWRESEHFLEVPFDSVLDPDAVEPGNVDEERNVYAAVEVDVGDQPDEVECRELLYRTGKSGVEIVTDWHKRAKRQIHGTDAYPLCFEHVKLDDLYVQKKGFSGWNDAAFRVIGAMCGVLVTYDDTTPQHIFALLRSALEQMTCDDEEGGKDWLDIGWNMIARLWEAEVQQVVARQQEEAAKTARAEQEKGDILDTLREARPGEVPDDPVEAKEFLERRMIASDGTMHRIMKSDGTYTVNGYPNTTLLAAIRDLGVSHLIRSHEVIGNVYKARSIGDILADHCIPISRTLFTATEQASYVRGVPGDRELVVPVHQLDSTLEPRWSSEVDAWLRTLFDERYDDGIRWLSHCLKVHRPICALNLYGASGAGKNLLVMGISECFRIKNANDGRVLGRFNAGLAHSPIVNFDEGVPTSMPGCARADETFRVLVAGGRIAVEGKGKDVCHAHIYPRLMFTSNDLDTLDPILGAAVQTESSIEAIEARLMSIAVPQEAADHLEQLGGRSYTSRWVGEESDYLLARHILWLNQQTPEERRGRLLVTGDSGLLAERRSPEVVHASVVLHLLAGGTDFVSERELRAKRLVRELTEKRKVVVVRTLEKAKFGPGVYFTRNAFNEVAEALNEKRRLGDAESWFKAVTKTGVVYDNKASFHIPSGGNERYKVASPQKLMEILLESGYDTAIYSAMLDGEEEAA